MRMNTGSSYSGPGVCVAENIPRGVVSAFPPRRLAVIGSEEGLEAPAPFHASPSHIGLWVE